MFLQALEKAKEAGRKERALVRQREQSGNGEHISLDLTYSVSLVFNSFFFFCDTINCVFEEVLGFSVSEWWLSTNMNNSHVKCHLSCRAAALHSDLFVGSREWPLFDTENVFSPVNI